MRSLLGAERRATTIRRTLRRQGERLQMALIAQDKEAAFKGQAAHVLKLGQHSGDGLAGRADQVGKLLVSEFEIDLLPHGAWHTVQIGELEQRRGYSTPDIAKDDVHRLSVGLPQPTGEHFDDLP